LESLFTINTINSTIAGYHCWFSSDNVTVVVNPGSIIGDLSVSGYSLATVYQSTLQYGEVTGIAYSTIYLYDCQVIDPVIIEAGGFLAVERVNFESLITILGNLSAADSNYSLSSLDFRYGSTVYYVSISQPALGTTTSYSTNQTLTVLGDVVAITQNFSLIEPFPPATISLNMAANNFVVLSTTISSPTPDNNTLLTSWNLSSVQPGSYYLSLSFGPGQAVSSRNITITGSLISSTGSTTSGQGNTGSSTANTGSSTANTGAATGTTVGQSSTLSASSTLITMFVCLLGFLL